MSARAGQLQRSLPGLGILRPVVPAARPRKLNVNHFAFMRSVVQGLDLRQSWERYFRAEDMDGGRTVKATIQWIRDEFAAAARREQRPGTARLVVLDTSRIPEDVPKLPSLADFAAERGLEDARQAEQIEAYEKEFGSASRRASRRARLVARQLEALRWLESMVAEPPRAGDAVASWLNPTLARHLEAAGIFTIAQLVERINGIGKRWTASLHSLGVAKGQRIEAWLREHEATLGLAVGRHVAVARSQLYSHELQAVVQPATGIRPLEKFLVPEELDGSRGAYRRPQAQCLLKARTDYEAILAWLRSKHGLTPEQKTRLVARRRQKDSGTPGEQGGLEWLRSLSNTQRAYRKEAERFLLWAIVEKGRALSSMTQEDCVEYRDFLADPQPRSRWCGDRGRERWSPLWRPFEGPLSAGAQQQAVTILGNLYGFLVDQNYLMGNPWSSVTVPRGPAKVNAGRSFTVKQWAFIEGELAELGNTSRSQRLKLALHLLYATGLRLSEIVAAKVEDLQWLEYPSDSVDEEPLEGHVLRVVGKGQRVREVPVPREVIDELLGYLGGRRLTSSSMPADGKAHLLGKAADAGERPSGLVGRQLPVDASQGVAATTLYDQIKAFFRACSMQLLQRGDAKGAARFAKASTHWLRHTHASHAIAAGMPIEVAQQNLGHASLATTTIYVRTEERRRMKAVNRFWETRAGR